MEPTGFSFLSPYHLNGLWGLAHTDFFVCPGRGVQSWPLPLRSEQAPLFSKLLQGPIKQPGGRVPGRTVLPLSWGRGISVGNSLWILALLILPVQSFFRGLSSKPVAGFLAGLFSPSVGAGGSPWAIPSGFSPCSSCRAAKA